MTPGEIPRTYAEVITLTLEGLDARYGSPLAFLKEEGVTSDRQEALRRAVLEASQ